MELDRISNFPNDVTDKILSFLTLKEAVRTSVLSSVWKDKWAMLSGLVFDEKCFSTDNCETFVNIVYHFLDVGDLPGRLLKPCLDLNFLSLLVYFHDPSEILTSLYLLRSSPALEVLHVEMSYLLKLLTFFRHKVKMNSVLMKKTLAELDFIKLLLLKSPVLETITIQAVSAYGSSEVFKKLLQLRIWEDCYSNFLTVEQNAPGPAAKEQRKPSKSHSQKQAELDRISNLPSGVIEIILEHLPIKEAVRTSVLSTKWRYKSAMFQSLKFDEQCVSTQNPITFVHIVDQVLLLHVGPIRKFKLSHRDLLAPADIDRWILYLSRSSVKHLILEIGIDQRYKLPSCLFSCEDIICLCLHNCILKPPSTFSGFKSLKRLTLERVTLTQHVFESFILGCPMLKGLILRNCNGFRHLNIDAPNLKFLVIEGDFEDVNLRNTLNLEYVYVALEFNVRERRVVGISSNLLKFVVHLPHVRCLEITSYSLKYLAVGATAMPGKLPEPLIYLKLLSMSVSFTDLKEITTALCLIRSSPALQELEIFVHRDNQNVQGEVNSWLEHLEDNLDYQFTQLRRTEITCISSTNKAELALIKFLLLSSPVLERMTLQPATGDGSLEMLKKVVRFRRASVQAEIIFLDP
ncbi:hypothetical protein ACLB2K_012675 [Fragaria x ananassa]